MNRSSYIPTLDGLRGLAALLVVGAHIGFVFPSLSPYVVSMGSEAVGLFFALSGFLMAHLYATDAPTKEKVLDFLVSRFARIYPVYLAAVLFVALLSNVPTLGFIQPLSGSIDLLRHVLLVGSSGVFWSISPEIQFYLVFPVLWLSLNRPVQHSAIITCFAVMVSADGLLNLPGPGILLLSKLPYFLLGAIAGKIHCLWGNQKASTYEGIAALVLLVLFFNYSHVLPQQGPEFWGLQSAVAAAVIVAIIARQPPIVARLFTLAPMRFLGNISFSLYLFHVPAMFLARQALSLVLPEPLLIAVSLLSAVATAWFIHKLIEVPSRRAVMVVWRRYRSSAGGGNRPDQQIERAILQLREAENRMLAQEESADVKLADHVDVERRSGNVAHR